MRNDHLLSLNSRTPCRTGPDGFPLTERVSLPQIRAAEVGIGLARYKLKYQSWLFWKDVAGDAVEVTSIIDHEARTITISRNIRPEHHAGLLHRVIRQARQEHLQAVAVQLDGDDGCELSRSLMIV